MNFINYLPAAVNNLLTPVNSNKLSTFHYDSPIEDLLGKELALFVKESASISPQYKIETTRGFFILDFLIEINGRKFAIECDGKEYHEYYADLYRDALLLGEEHINEMIRLKGSDIFLYLDTCICFLSVIMPDIFSQKAKTVLDTKARNERLANSPLDTEGLKYYTPIFRSLDNLDHIEGENCRLCEGVSITRRIDRIFQYPSGYLADWCEAYCFIHTQKIRDRNNFIEAWRNRFRRSENQF